MKSLEKSTGTPPPQRLVVRGETVREQYDSLRDQADKQGLESLFYTLREEAKDYAERIALDPQQTERILKQYDGIVDALRREPNVAEPNINAMLRYFLEGKILDYESNTAPLQFLREERVLKKGQSLLDLGAGPGVSVELWNQENPGLLLARGVDISMSFVMIRAQMMSLGLIDSSWQDLRQQSGVEDGAYEVSMSNLTLDRVRNPEQLINNLINATRKGGAIAIGTLLPIVPEDDGENVANRIVYTPKELRIVPGEDPEVDKRRLQEVMETQLNSKVDVNNVPFQMNCSDGVQDYPNFYIFTGQKEQA